MKKIFVFLVGIICSWGMSAQKKIEMSSPNGKIHLSVMISDRITYDVVYEDELLLSQCELRMKIGNKQLGENPRLIRKKMKSISENVTPVVPMKFLEITDCYNFMQLDFDQDYSVNFRLYNNGVAYRFVTAIKGPVDVENEMVCVNFPDNYVLHLQQPAGFKTSCEEEYGHIRSEDWKPEDKMAFLPILIDTQKGYKILMSESALSDYPTMFLQGHGHNGFVSVFPKVPAETVEESDRSVRILREEPYIARTAGKRSFPWRYFVITQRDEELIENTMTFQLADRNLLEDVSWVKPGLASWEWWNGAIPYGPDVDFVAGCNQATYKYFIDFASRYQIPYIIMDEGWAKDNRNPYEANPDIDLQSLVRYGQEKNVGIFLWLPWLTVEKCGDLFELYEKWGIRGIKIDFMDRGDQWMVNFYERVAKKAAEHHLLIDFHGAFKPAGLERMYPNVLSYEGVRGMEQMSKCIPDNSIYLPFIRNAVGPMDYTPGAMLSMQPECYNAKRPNSASIGTRAYQMALFVLFESGLQMMADNPTLYYKNAACTEFLTKIPQTWDETIALKAMVGEYVIVAKRKGSRWYIGGMTNGKKCSRQFKISLNFLNENKEYQVTSFEDGVNAGRQAMDYRMKEFVVNSTDTLEINMVRNGGFAAIIE